ELREGTAVAVEATIANFGMQPIALCTPSIDRPLEPAALHGFDATIERDPRHDLRMREMPARASDFPDALIGLRPRLLEMSEQRLLEIPGIGIGLDACASRDVQRVHDFAVDIELQLP